MICFITAIYGNYETACKPFVKQSIPCDFICFTDNPKIDTNGWELDTTTLLPLGSSFFQAKFFKQQFFKIPRLQKYDTIVWVDGTIELINTDTAKLLSIEPEMVLYEHEYHRELIIEVIEASKLKRYEGQNIKQQWIDYLDEGFKESNVWITCFISFKKNHIPFLNEWWNQTLKYTTEDQVSFPYVCWKFNYEPITLKGAAHHKTLHYIKHNHG